jgi:hypothetical protein
MIKWKPPATHCEFDLDRGLGNQHLIATKRPALQPTFVFKSPIVEALRQYSA